MRFPRISRIRSDKPARALFWVSPTRRLYDLFWAIHNMKAQTPDAVVARLNAALNAAIEDEATRKIVLAGTDGVVFVADSQARQLDENIESFQDLHANLADQGVEVTMAPAGTVNLTYAVLTSAPRVPTAASMKPTCRLYFRRRTAM